MCIRDSRKALKDLGMEQIPVISINIAGLESNPGFKFTPAIVKKCLMGVMYGDLFMRVLYATRPYEAEPGSANALYDRWVEKARAVSYTHLDVYKRQTHSRK